MKRLLRARLNPPLVWSLTSAAVLSVLGVAASGCEGDVQGTSGSAGAGGVGGQSGAGGGGGVAGAGGEAGAGGGSVCAPGAVKDCYSGPPYTVNTGVCKIGMQVCDAGGTGFGPCEGDVTPTAEQCNTLADDESCDGTPACTGEHQWSLRFGGAASQAGRRVAVGAAGEVLLIGDFQDTVDFGGGALKNQSAFDADIFVTKLDADGKHVFSKGFGDANDNIQEECSITTDLMKNTIVAGSLIGAVDFGGGLLTSADGYDVFLVKLDADGNHVWSKRFGGGGSQWITGVAADKDGNILLAGRFEGSIDFGGAPLVSAGAYDIFAAKLTPAGEPVWSLRLGDANDDYSGGITADEAGNAILTASFDGALTVGGDSLTSVGSYDFAVVKMDSAGAIQWGKRLGSAGFDTEPSVAAFPGGDVLVAGHSSSRVYVAKLDAAGGLGWEKSFGSGMGFVVARAGADGAGNAIVAGSFTGVTLDFGGGALPCAGQYDVFAAKLDTNGNHIWSRRFGDADDQQALGAAVDGAGGLVIAGFFGGTVDFGGGALVCEEPSDIFVARFSP